MTKEEIYKASDVLNSILDNYLHGGEAAEVVTKFEDELTKSNLTKEEPASDDFTKALAECIHQAQYNVVDPLVLAETWKDELIKLAKSEEPVSEDLGDYINELSKQFPEVSFAKLSRIAVRVAKWQKEQIMAKAIDAQCFGFQGAALFSFRLPSDKYLVGSNVKVILINE